MNPDDTVAALSAAGASAVADAAWAESGAMFLTGRSDGPPLAAPEGFVERLRAIGDVLAETSEKLGHRVDVDPLALLGERAAIAGLHRGGDISCGGAARLLPAADGWLAVNLPRPDDLDLLPAWLPERITHNLYGLSAPASGVVGIDPDLWAALASAVANQPAAFLANQAQVLGLPVAALPTSPIVPREPSPSPPPQAAPVAGPTTGPLEGLPVSAARRADATPAPFEGLLVIDLSSLWAGPLCTHLLQLVGARVVKVESLHRPDGARNGLPEFFDLLHAGQESVALDFRTEEGRKTLRTLVEAADVVVEASRPRALEQLGLCAETIIEGRHGEGAGRAGPHEARPRVWLSITGYGRAAPGRDKVAFGDDAAVAGRLVAWDEAGPCFLADAVADPCAGLVSAGAILRALSVGGRWQLDVSMRDVAAYLAGSNARVARRAPDLPAAPPRARTPSGPGPRLGEHTATVLAELGCA